MKKIFKYFGLALSVALMGAFAACNPVDENDLADLGLGIKVFFPTKVVAGQPMTINGSGFSDAVEVVFPDGVSVTNFEIVSNDMIRVIAPKGIAAEGGKISVVTTSDKAESAESLTLGHTEVSGYSKQPGETVTGGEQITIYGTDLEFITSIEFIDEDGNPIVVTHEQFYRKGTNSIIVIVPRKVMTGTFAAKMGTYDGQEILMDEFAYETAQESGGGHWEYTKTVIWENDGSKGAISWNGDYRFSSEEAVTGEEIYAFPMDIWNKLKSETFYATIQSEDPQIRVTTGWWTTTWTGDDIYTGNEHLTDNGDGTFALEINFGDDPIVDLIDAQHLLFTGDRYYLVDLYFQDATWVDGGGQLVVTEIPVWENDGSKGAINWSGDYRFSSEEAVTGEEIYAFPMEIWNKLKSETFYVTLESEDPQIRVTTGWWSTTWTGDDIYAGNEKLTDNGDGTFTLEVNFGDDPILDVIDAQHLLLTGVGYTPLKIFFREETWVEGGGNGPEPVVFWENDGSKGAISWSGDYRFSNPDAATGEEIAILDADVWNIIKTGTFYMVFDSADAQIRVTDGWWSTTWTGNDLYVGDERITDNSDGTYTLEVNLEGDPLLDDLDSHHLLFTGDKYTPLKLYYNK